MPAIYEKNGGYHLRIYSNVDLKTGTPLAALGNDGKPLRKQQTICLTRVEDVKDRARLSGQFPDSVNALANVKIAEIEGWEAAAKNGEPVRPTGDMTIAEFYETVFLPYIKREKSHSTVKTYQAYWNGYLKAHFNHSKTFANYESFMATNFLEQSATRLSQNTVTHIRSVGSAIFAYAISKGLIKASGDDALFANPWFHARKNIKCVKVEDTYAYSKNEVEQILDALEHVSGREEYSARVSTMLVATCFYAGLRPSEAAALKWENVDLNEGLLNICEAYVDRKFKDETKTGEDRIVTMLPQLLNRFKIWSAIWQHPTTGLVLPNKAGDAPINVNDMGARIIGPTLEKVGLDWHGLYACRRGFGTELYNHGATMEEIAAAMGNSPAVAFRNYVKDKTRTGAKGIAKWANAGVLRPATGRKFRTPAPALVENNQ
jgi:integrase